MYEFHEPLKIVQAIVIPLWLQIAITVLMLVMKIVMALIMKPRGGGGGRVDPGTRVTVRDSVGPREIVYGRTRKFGTFLFMSTSGDKNAILNVVIVFAGHECDAIEKVYFNDDEVQFDTGDDRYAVGFYQDNVFREVKLGAPGEPAFPDLVAQGLGWTENHRADGCCTVRFRLVWNVDKYPQGLPNISVLMRGKKVYDPVLLLTQWSDNSALCVADYLTDDNYGRGEDFATGINQNDIIASRNACAETFVNPKGIVEKRYTCNGFFKTDRQPVDILNSLLTSMAGHVSYVGGVWKIMAGVWTPPVFALTADDFRGPLKVPVVASAKDSFNAVRGTFISKDENYIQTSFPAVLSPAYEAEDGERVYTDIDLEFTTSPYVAQRIARIFLRRSRQEIAFQGRVALRMWAYIPGDNGTITYPIFGWDGKLFEIAEMGLILGGEDEGVVTAQEVEVSLRETTDFIFDVNASEDADYDPAPNTNLPDIFNVSPPASINVAEEKYVTRDGGGVKAKIIVTFTASPDAFVTSGGHYEVQYKPVASSVWLDTPNTKETRVEINDAAPGDYDFRAKAVNSRGVSSTYITKTQKIVGLSDPPTEPQNFTVSAVGGLALLEWDPIDEIDVKIGGVVVIRHCSLMSGATWAQGTAIGRSVNGSQNATAVPLKPGTYMAKTLDAGGVWSETWAAATTDQSGLFNFTSLITVTESPDFTGTKTNTAVLSGALKLTGPGLFSTVPDVGDLPSFAFIDGLVNSTGSYNFATKPDLGSVKRVRATGLISSLVYSELDKMSLWPSVGARAKFGGNVTGNEADARMWLRKTNDDPNTGSPTWTAWNRLDSSEHSARGFDLKVDLETLDTSYNIQITQLAVAIEEVV